MIFFIGLCVHLYWFIRGIFSTILINQFDGALRLLAEHAVIQQWTLYKDVSIVYPPGYALFFGTLFRFVSPNNRQTIITFAIFIFVCIGVWSVQRMLKCSYTDWRIGIFLLISSLWYQQVSGDAFALPLMFLLILCIVHQKLSTTVALLAGILAFFRWDFPLFTSVLMWGMVGYEYVCFKKETYVKTALALTLGLSAGLGILALYAFTQGTLTQAFDAIVTIPTRIILPYRSLPLPLPWHAPRILNALVYVALLGWILCAVLAEKKNIRDVVVLCIPFIFLPYATGRADWSHALPLFSSVLFVTLYVKTKQRYIHHVTLGMLVLFFLRILLPQHIWEPQAQSNMYTHIAECAQRVQTYNAQSLFVGREQYNRYIINVASLYFTRPDLRPATPYVSDEPGLQSSCIYGERIQQDLVRTPKPMLSFIELGEQPLEPNATQTLRSCGHIERFLSTSPYTSLGQCYAYGHTFDVRAYK